MAALLVVGVVILAALLVPRIVRFLVPSGAEQPPQDKTALTRREFLGIAAALAPPLLLQCAAELRAGSLNFNAYETNIILELTTP